MIIHDEIPGCENDMGHTIVMDPSGTHLTKTFNSSDDVTALLKIVSKANNVFLQKIHPDVVKVDDHTVKIARYGVSMEEYLNFNIDSETMFNMIQNVLELVGELHAAGVYHGDIVSSKHIHMGNVLIDPEDCLSKSKTRLIDFSLERVLHKNSILSHEALNVKCMYDKIKRDRARSMGHMNRGGRIEQTDSDRSVIRTLF